jgi:putative ABC transport system substrate-binding protein
MNKKVIIAILALIVLVVASLWFANRHQAKQGKTISIVSIVKIEPITQLEDGFKAEILKSEFAKNDSVTFTYDNAQGDASLQNQIVDKIIKNKPDLVYVLGTPLATAIQKRDSSLIIVQGAVTDPIEAGLAKSWDGSGKNYAATTDLPPVDEQIELIRKVIPGIKTLGLIYNTGEPNSVAVVKRIRKYVEDNKLDVALAERPVSNTSEISTVTESLSGKVQAIYIPPDNTVHAAIKVVCKVANDNRIPVFTNVETSLADGALAALSLDYTKLGEQSADIALQILQGKAKPGEIPIKPTNSPKFIVNEKIARTLNFDLSVLKGMPNIEFKTP